MIKIPVQIIERFLLALNEFKSETNIQKLTVI